MLQRIFIYYLFLFSWFEATVTEKNVIINATQSERRTFTSGEKADGSTWAAQSHLASNTPGSQQQHLNQPPSLRDALSRVERKLTDQHGLLNPTWTLALEDQDGGPLLYCCFQTVEKDATQSERRTFTSGEKADGSTWAAQSHLASNTPGSQQQHLNQPPSLRDALSRVERKLTDQHGLLNPTWQATHLAHNNSISISHPV
ncbi:uncharacterized protein LOC121636298 isoform X3 [Melanotaenia boesemani]|uniref:uncharacterized protein LOC121636298 isoform X3 n=1 Tax=Melanotaenia boesemani TaxID=1250792 RepID=UPI001C043E5C|nr:uncharacterized protein LOC121636298 isoform X3 [Melanotaenia boesemani]